MRSGRVFLIAVWHCNLFTGRSYGGVVAKHNRWSLLPMYGIIFYGFGCLYCFSCVLYVCEERTCMFREKLLCHDKVSWILTHRGKGRRAKG